MRRSIVTATRAYPQFVAAGGENLPRDILSLLFPLSYWDVIRKHATRNGLDPYFVAALISQESAFAAEFRSAANGFGLMQILPSQAMKYARTLGLPGSPTSLMNPEANIQIGTAQLADQLRRFGSLHLFLASYNAGENRAIRWQAERQGISTEEFIDDIPYPETQNYVKRVLGLADNYRRLYGGDTAK